MNQKATLGNERTHARPPPDGIAVAVAIKIRLPQGWGDTRGRSGCFWKQKTCSASRGGPPEVAAATQRPKSIPEKQTGNKKRRSPHRLVVRTSRCGRDNPGSTPGEDNISRRARIPKLWSAIASVAGRLVAQFDVAKVSTFVRASDLRKVMPTRHRYEAACGACAVVTQCFLFAGRVPSQDLKTR